MPTNIIQEVIGTEVLSIIEKFALKSETGIILDVDDLKNNLFGHVNNIDIRDSISETYYGARWIYRLGVAFIQKNAYCNAVHIRTQVIDYASICEALLADIIIECVKNHVTSTSNHWEYPACDASNMPQGRKINWTTASNDSDYLNYVNRMQFQARIEAAKGFAVISPTLATNLHTLRKHRNSVHLTRKIVDGSTYYLNMAKTAHKYMFDLNTSISKWKQNNLP